jgi:hypothetical protein
MTVQNLPFTPQYIVEDDKSDKTLLDLTRPTYMGVEEAEEDELRKELHQATITIKEFAKVYKIADDKLDESVKNNEFEYYGIDTGMNINVPRGRIEALRFYLSIYADGKQSEDAWVYDGFPNDKIRHITVLKGKLKLGVNSLLNIIPMTQLFANVIYMDIEPWEIDWGYDKLDVGFNGSLTNNVDWYLSGENFIQNFNCYVTLRKKKSARHIYAVAKARWEYKPESQGILSWFRNRFNRDKIWVKGEERSIKIIKA